MKYAKYINETQIDRNIPRTATWEGRLVTGDITLFPGLPESLGFLPLDETPAPEPPAGYHEEARYAVENGRIRQSWVEVADPPAPPRSFSKFRLKLAIADAGLLPQFTQMLASFEVRPGYSAAEAFADALTLDEDNPKFSDAVALAKQTFSLTDEQVEAILAASIAE